MDIKWLVIALLLFFGAIIIFQDDLRRMGSPEGSTDGELNSVEAPSKGRSSGEEPTTDPNS